MIFTIYCAINNIIIQNRELNNIITNGLIPKPHINNETISQTQRIISNLIIQNRELNNIITNGLIPRPYINNETISQTQRIIYFNKLISNLKHNLIKCKRNTNISITPKELDELYIKQLGKCAISKKNLTFYYSKSNKNINKLKIRNLRKINDFNVSISRIDNNKDFNRNNIQLIACRINLMKNNLSVNQFIELCSKVVKNNNYLTLK